MYRGRGGPRQATPANVQCQKCLKRDEFSVPSHGVPERHYSYECKEPSQARPYVSRPSRTQQLRNPKLVPKLTNDKPEELMRKKGVADEELAKKEAERARQRRARDDGSDDEGAPPKRQRSPSFDSVSTVSTRHSRSPSPPPRRRSPSPQPQPRHDAPAGPSRYRDSRSPEGDYSRSPSPAVGRHSPGPPPRRQRSPSRDSRSPPRRQEQRYRERSADRSARSVSRRSPSRSPVRQGGGGRPDDRAGPRQARGDHNDRPVRREEPPRERSLSPFSQRVALTRSMNQAR